MELTLIRHLPTEWNEKGVLQGSKDIPIIELTDANKKAIETNKKLLKPTYSLILTSELSRTQQTAKCYGYERFKIEPLLNELNFGEFEGKEKRLLTETYKDEWFTRPGEIMLGEKISNLEKRVHTFLHKYKDFESILVFGHGSWIRACVSCLTFGAINNMNQLEIKNNQLLTINVREEEHKIERHHI